MNQTIEEQRAKQNVIILKIVQWLTQIRFKQVKLHGRSISYMY